MRTKQDLLNALSQKGWEYHAKLNYLHKESHAFEVGFDEEVFSVDGLLTFDEVKLILELSEMLKND